jgi:hypothetical protein
MKIEDQTYNHLISNIGDLLQKGRQQAAQSVNTILVQTYWHIGQHIVEFEQKGDVKAEYGVQLLDKLSKDLTLNYGKGFSRSNLFQIRLFYIKFQKIQTLSGQLTWSHYTEILKANSDLELGFYTKQCEYERWSVRDLKRNMKSSLFERIALSKDKEGVLKLAAEGHITETAEDLIKDPFVLEFFKVVQNKLLWALSQQTAAELVYRRVDAGLPLLGMQSFDKKSSLAIKKSDVIIAKNYLAEDEIKLLGLPYGR